MNGKQLKREWHRSGSRKSLKAWGLKHRQAATEAWLRRKAGR